MMTSFIWINTNLYLTGILKLNLLLNMCITFKQPSDDHLTLEEGTRGPGTGSQHSEVTSEAKGEEPETVDGLSE
jgi:hypothetical protein